ncbi:hypothetical protein [Prochlorococcus sp. MIT 0718]|uniref:hypothetical protein n=1 Tax=Prochlorococcus sp. MIT 0718 TaxID=3082539 RepID=UPI0039B09402
MAAESSRDDWAAEVIDSAACRLAGSKVERLLHALAKVLYQGFNPRRGGLSRLERLPPTTSAQQLAWMSRYGSSRCRAMPMSQLARIARRSAHQARLFLGKSP